MYHCLACNGFGSCGVFHLCSVILCAYAKDCAVTTLVETAAGNLSDHFLFTCFCPNCFCFSTAVTQPSCAFLAFVVLLSEWVTQNAGYKLSNSCSCFAINPFRFLRPFFTCSALFCADLEHACKSAFLNADFSRQILSKLRNAYNKLI